MAETDSLHSTNTALQSTDTRNLLDTIDKLRSQGISSYIDSGKSLVLEAVSGVRFPSKDNLCTRFATELILCRDPVVPLCICLC